MNTYESGTVKHIKFSHQDRQNIVQIIQHGNIILNHFSQSEFIKYENDMLQRLNYVACPIHMKCS